MSNCEVIVIMNQKEAEAYRQLAWEVIDLGEKEVKRGRDNAVRWSF